MKNYKLILLIVWSVILVSCVNNIPNKERYDNDNRSAKVDSFEWDNSRMMLDSTGNSVRLDSIEREAARIMLDSIGKVANCGCDQLKTAKGVSDMFSGFEAMYNNRFLADYIYQGEEIDGYYHHLYLCESLLLFGCEDRRLHDSEFHYSQEIIDGYKRYQEADFKYFADYYQILNRNGFYLTGEVGEYLEELILDHQYLEHFDNNQEGISQVKMNHLEMDELEYYCSDETYNIECLQKVYDEFDRRVSVNYSELIESTNQNHHKSVQKKWLKYRDKEFAFIEKIVDEDGSMIPLLILDYKISVLKNRTVETSKINSDSRTLNELKSKLKTVEEKHTSSYNNVIGRDKISGEIKKLFSAAHSSWLEYRNEENLIQDGESEIENLQKKITLLENRTLILNIFNSYLQTVE